MLKQITLAISIIAVTTATAFAASAAPQLGQIMINQTKLGGNNGFVVHASKTGNPGTWQAMNNNNSGSTAFVTNSPDIYLKITSKPNTVVYHCKIDTSSDYITSNSQAIIQIGNSVDKLTQDKVSNNPHNYATPININSSQVPYCNVV